MMTQALSDIENRNMPGGETSMPSTRYKGSFDCFIQSVRKEGLRSMFKGLVPAIARGAPFNLIYFAVFEEMSQRILGYSQI
jgi:hypothetical protein